MAREKNFPLEKVLTISARDYCEMEGVKLSDYEAIGVHVHVTGIPHLGVVRTKLDSFVPPGTEIIVDYTVAVYDEALLGSGTALIPKRKC